MAEEKGVGQLLLWIYKGDFRNCNLHSEGFWGVRSFRTASLLKELLKADGELPSTFLS